MNRLAHARSPYLIQHAANPVDWYEWGDEAFAAARAADKPIFLSVGYSTCHWCHVMAHESFEQPAIAAILNDHFVSIKVDREERPDVDRVYMAFVQATTGSGGWPMSVWLTPQLEPFFGGTYFPPSARWGRPGFIDVLTELARLWREDRLKVIASASSAMTHLRRVSGTTGGDALPSTDALESTVAQFRDAFDPREGGFGGAPKFPRPSELLFLLREFGRTGADDARGMAAQTLAAMALGGMRDHVGGGFHRYSVDAQWRVPHFEKMLYDQAQITVACLEAAQATGEAFFAEVAEDTLRYVMREMTDTGGGFYSAEDADSIPPEAAGRADAHASEGAFYLWRAGEIREQLGDEDAAAFADRFGVREDGNALSDPQQEFAGKNILYMARTIEEVAADAGRDPVDVSAALSRGRIVLFEARLERPRPHLDDKVLTAWNGLMIAAFARAARVLAPGDRSNGYLDAAVRAASFLRAAMWNGSARTLFRRYRAGDAGIDAYAEDYACLIWGVLELFQATGDVEWLEWAIVLQRRQDELFWDDDQGGWFSTTGSDDSVLIRMKDDYDGAEPTPSSIAVNNLLVLAHLVEDPKWVERIERTLRLFAPRLEQMGRSVPMMAAALASYTAGVRQVVIVGDDRAALDAAVARAYRPFAVSISVDPARQQALSETLPWLRGMMSVDGRAAAYVCQGFTCERPVTDSESLASLLDRG